MMLPSGAVASVAAMGDLGWKFFLKMAGFFVVGGIVLFILLAIFAKLIYAWGFLAAFLVVALLACIAGYLADRRNAGAS
jgi:putative flippase GtrA